jgi:hypothetical protein
MVSYPLAGRHSACTKARWAGLFPRESDLRHGSADRHLARREVAGRPSPHPVLDRLSRAQSRMAAPWSFALRCLNLRAFSKLFGHCSRLRRASNILNSLESGVESPGIQRRGSPVSCRHASKIIRRDTRELCAERLLNRCVLALTSGASPPPSPPKTKVKAGTAVKVRSTVVRAGAIVVRGGTVIIGGGARVVSPASIAVGASVHPPVNSAVTPISNRACLIDTQLYPTRRYLR